MKLTKRMRLYLLIIGVLSAAVILRPDGEALEPEAAAIVEAVERPSDVQRLPRINVRESVMPDALFVADEPVVEVFAPVVTSPSIQPAEPVRPEIGILGWMLSGAKPHVFVEWKGENHALSPSQALDETYRFEGIDQGMASFTYLPEGTVRMYRVGELGSME